MATRFVFCRRYSRLSKAIRNVGILAHIDAGKTTTTERMLLNTGTIKRAGEVDQGTTMTDYLDQERERGISITSAVATMKWQEHDINLIDTPGHVDFTLEVERALVVLDGTITVLDAVKGVEAQTQTVWSQARNHKIPNIFYINKFDKKNANLNLCLKSIKNKLPNVLPLLIHLPYYCTKTNKFIGIMDVIELKLEYWDIVNKSNDLSIESHSRKISDSEEIFVSCISARQKLLESLVDLDEGNLRDEFLILDNPATLIPIHMINDALRKATLSAKASPVLIGSSKLNIGVNNILNKIITCLPNPTEKKISSKFSNLAEHSDHFTGLAFKVIHDKYKGPLTFLRLYSGFLNPGQIIQNITRSLSEKVEQIIQVTGDHFVELDSSSAGNIVAVSGLKNCYTGDFLIDTKFSKVSDDEDYSDLISIPTPVIYASIEASGLSEVKSLENALLELSKEDPSLMFKRDEETHQLIIGGMGKLHLEIIFDRIINDYKLRNTRLGKVKIAYKECPSNGIDSKVLHDYNVIEKIQGVNIKLSIQMSTITLPDFNTKCNIEFLNSRDFKWSAIDQKHVRVIKESITAAVDNGGQLLRSPLTGIKIIVHNFIIEPTDISMLSKTNHLFIRSFSMEAARGLLKKVPTNLLEPMMKVEISFNISDSETKYYVSNVLSDLSRRRSQIVNKESIHNASNLDSITAFVPLAETTDYANKLRSLTSGNASLHMSFSHYDIMSKLSQENIINKIIYRSRN